MSADRPICTVGHHNAGRGRYGWFAATRQGCIITHTSLMADKWKPEDARAEAEARFPDHLVVLPDDPKPWAR